MAYLVNVTSANDTRVLLKLFKLDLRFWHRWFWRVLFSGATPCVPLKISRRFGWTCRLHLQHEAGSKQSWFLAWLILQPLKMEHTYSDEMSVDFQRNAHRYMREDWTLHNPRCVNSRSCCDLLHDDFLLGVLFSSDDECDLFLVSTYVSEERHYLQSRRISHARNQREAGGKQRRLALSELNGVMSQEIKLSITKYVDPTISRVQWWKRHNQLPVRSAVRAWRWSVVVVMQVSNRATERDGSEIVLYEHFKRRRIIFKMTKYIV
jgi:hypothetical protein